MPSILERLKEHQELGFTPMHMPGHKRNVDCGDYLNELCASLDITEIEGFDNLHKPQGILAKSMKKASELWGSNESFFLVGGSTCGILASIRSAVCNGDEIIVARNCHKSVYNAIELLELNAHFILPTIDEDFGIYGSITPEQIDFAFKKHPNSKLVILTSPTYEGIISDIKSICKIAHNYNVPVVVDEAHGAHLSFYNFPKGAIKSGADIVIQSLHKTLPSLTQTAIAHLNSDLISANNLANELSIFQTSSPSYLLLASIDGCVNLVKEQGEALFNQWEMALNLFSKTVKKLKNLSILGYGFDNIKNHKGIFDFDNSKIVISTRNTNLLGTNVAKILRDDYKIEVEMASAQYLIAMTGLGDKTENILKLANAVLEIDKRCRHKKANESSPIISTLPKINHKASKALQLPSQNINIEKSCNKTSAEYVWAYPPGVPIIVPGEEINQEIINDLQTLKNCGVDVFKTSGYDVNSIKVLL